MASRAFVARLTITFFDFRRVGLYVPQRRRGEQQQFDILTQQAAKHRLHAGKEEVQIQHQRMCGGAAAEGQQVLGERAARSPA